MQQQDADNLVTTLKISDDFSKVITNKINKVKHVSQLELDSFIKNDSDFKNIYNYANKLLEDNLFVIIKNIGFNKERAIFESFVKLFGNFYGAIEYTDVKMDCFYTGCKFDKIDFHNDDAIDLENQPDIGFIQVLTEDPLKTTKNGIVKIDDVIKYLEITDQSFLNTLFEYKMPMLSFGINYDGLNKDKILVQETILYKDNNNVINVRFDLSRINYFYWKENITQSNKEKKILNNFFSILKKFKYEFYLEEGDILIHKNKRTLHDRSECNFLLNQDGMLNTREIFVSFVNR